MRKIGKWLVPLALIVIVLALPGFVSAAPTYQVTLTPQPADNTSTIPVGARYITGAYYGYDTTNQYFKMGVRTAPEPAPSPSSDSDSWNIYINSKSGGGQPTSNISLIGIDYVINVNFKGQGSNNQYQNLQLWTYVGGGTPWTSTTPSELTMSTLGVVPATNTLEWTFARSGGTGADAIFGINYDFWYGTANGSTPGTGVALYDLSPKYHTPIHSAAWLLGSGIIGLIGLQRRRARKA